MTGLVSVADGLRPQPDYGFLPPTIKAWAGYVGTASIGAWTKDQVAALEATGRLWIPIWTPGDGATYSNAEAFSDAASMLAGLHALGITDSRWVFLDIERSRWISTPTATENAARLWCSVMRASGWPRAGWYGPCASSAPWRACWTGAPPVSLPPGCIGVQYDHALSGDRYDISRFDPTILEVGPLSVTGPEHWDTADWAAVRANLPALAPYDPAHADNPSVATVLHVLEGIRDGAPGFESLPDELAKILAAIKALPPGSGPKSFTFQGQAIAGGA